MADPQDLMGRIGRAGTHIDPGLTDHDVDRLAAGAVRRRRRRTVRRVSFAVAALSTVAIGTALYRGMGTSRPDLVDKRSVATGPTSTAPTSALRLADGSSAMPLDTSTSLAVLEDSARRISIDLPRGRARFEVVPNRERLFSVRAGDVTVTVVGTIFTVERIADRVGVSVERGVVRVGWGVGTRELRVGESGWFPPLVVDAPVQPSGGHPRRAHGGPGPLVVSGARTDDGSLVPVPADSRTAADLLSAADGARVAGHPDEAAALLRVLLQKHRRDPRAPLAAFTLGRVLMIELDLPREAAAAFAEARLLAPGGPFAEDALAREAQAFDSAGAAHEARARALEYLRRYPNGRRSEAAKRLAGK